MVRLMVFAYAIGGRTVLADAFQLAYLIPNTIYEFIAGGLLSAVFIPILVRQQEETGKDSKETWQVANLLLGGVGLILTVASLVGILASPWIIDGMTAMGKGSSLEDKQELATFLFRYFAPQILFLGINAIFMAILNSLEIFAVTAAAPILNNIVCIGAFLGYHYGYIGVTGLAIWTTLGTVAMALIQLPYVIKAGMSIRPRINLRHPVFHSVTSLGWPIFLVSIANFFGWTVRTNLLSTVLGAFAIYTFCFQIIMMPYGIFAVSIATVLYPTLSRHAANKRRDEFVSDMSLGLRWTTFILLPVSLGLMVLAMPIIRVLFEHRGGMFTYADSLFASDFLRYYALSIAPYGLVMFATRIFYSMKDTGTPAIINIAGVVFNGVLSYILLKQTGAAGIALASSVTYAVTTAVSLVFIRKVTTGLGGRSFWIAMGKMAIASVLMAVVVHSAEIWTRPTLIVMERGSRLEMPVPPSSQKGNFSVIKSEQDFRRVWAALGRPGETLPKMDFASNHLALIWGPQSHTTTTLDLDESTTRPVNASDLRLSVLIRPTAKFTTSSLAADASTSPSYALVQIHKPGAKIHLDMTRVQPGEKASRFEFPAELLRLLLLITVGAIVYGLTAIVFRMPELESVINMVRRKIGSPKRES